MSKYATAVANYYAKKGEAVTAALLVYLDGVTLILITSNDTQSTLVTLLRQTEPYGFAIKANVRSDDDYCGVVQIEYPSGKPTYNGTMEALYGCCEPHEFLADVVGECLLQNKVGGLEWKDHRQSDMHGMDDFVRWLLRVEESQ